MSRLLFERKTARFAAARLAGAVMPGLGASVGPLSLTNEPVREPAADWLTLRPRLSGICGSDLALIDGTAAAYFDPLVSYPFTPGHEVVADVDGTERRVVVVPVLSCEPRGITPLCPQCVAGRINLCERAAFGHLHAGLQTGFCTDTGGGWGSTMVAHPSQLVDVPDDLSDEDAVLVEPTACAVHAAARYTGQHTVVLGAGTVGLLTLAAITATRDRDRSAPVVVTARYPEQRRLAKELGADVVCSSDELPRAIRSTTGSMLLGDQLSGGAGDVFDCVGSSDTLQQALRVVAPAGNVHVVGMPANVSLELTALWHRETCLRGCYAYTRSSFDTAIDVIRTMRLGRLVSATYPLHEYTDAIAHAANAGHRGAVKVAFDLRERTHEMPRPGFVLEVDRSTPPSLFWRGENFSLERLPAGRSRVIYPPEPLEPLADIDGAIGHALEHPIDRDPLRTLLFPGMQLTICFDDVSLPLPKMRRPDIRQRVIEAVFDVAAEVGVDDVVLIAALGLHRRMHEYELRHALGDRIYDAFHPRGLLTQHDAEDPDNLEVIGHTDQGEVVEINKRAATSDLVVYVNINSVTMDGGWKSLSTGLASYRCLSEHHTGHTLQNTRSLMGHREHSALHQSIWRMGKVLRDHGPKIFQIETTLNTDMFPAPFDFISKREWEWTAKDRGLYVATTAALKRAPARAARKIFHDIEAPHQMTSVQAGETEAVHRMTIDKVLQQQLVQVEGQTDILTLGIPYVSPYNPDSVMNPILVMCMGLGYLFNMYRNKPLVREGGVIILTHPTYRDFNPVHHPSYIDFFEQVLPDTTDPVEMGKKWEKRYAEDEWYRHLYRTGNAYHGVHPFYAWYWGAHGQQHAGKVIIVGGDPPTVRRLGFTPASTLDDAFEIASDVVGRSPTITHLHVPALLVADVH